MTAWQITKKNTTSYDFVLLLDYAFTIEWNKINTHFYLCVRNIFIWMFQNEIVSKLLLNNRNALDAANSIICSC